MPNISKISRNLCVLSVTIIGATCSSDFHNNNNNNINSPYLYSEIQSLDFDIYEDESNNENKIPNVNSDSDQLRNPLNENNNYDDDNESNFSSNVGIEYFDDSENDSAPSSAMTSTTTTTSIVASTISYDGDYFVSSQAMVCNGGGSGDMDMNMNMDFIGTTKFAFLRNSVSAVAAQMIEQRLHPRKLVIERKMILN
ncbi:hypothetical protein FRACYDRAFT_241627 [Fragilariopsis cylindrus CCMP1102]|uniref:Uncharacterized protein n=1 Tax=Fragilariopsis cylindrus CCMP1102 TaxID=635003 RepID=A0A1E7F558_9STRA|nr:hypothetical protein FRACYDRAFT_241627 [Fragilariopsis cylindrus CCMP1102]|eukprot:OEU13290.1 hypothetical protein FRACYDRAFT_241627 [Fragilariopsis cylindrus CCMP1102]